MVRGGGGRRGVRGGRSEFTQPKKRSKPSRDSDSDTFNLSEHLDNISSNPDKIKQFVDELLQHSVFKDEIVSSLKAEVTAEILQTVCVPLQEKIEELESRIDDMEQYSRRNCLKLSGIIESSGENTDNIVLSIINKDILSPTGHKMDMRSIGRTHRVGPTGGTKRDIIVRFISYRDRDLVFRNKRNLKLRNASATSKVFVNEALTRKRASLFKKVRDLKKDSRIAECWTQDGKVLLKTHANKIIPVTTEYDLEQLLKPKVQASFTLPSGAASGGPVDIDCDANKSELNIDASVFKPVSGANTASTSTPLPSKKFSQTQTTVPAEGDISVTN